MGMADTTVQFKGYKLTQMSNGHIWVSKDNEFVSHINCDKIMTENELKEYAQEFVKLELVFDDLFNDESEDNNG